MGVFGNEKPVDRNQLRRKGLMWLASLASLALVVLTITSFISLKANAAMSDVAPQTAMEYESDPNALLAAYRHVEVASVSDAIEQVIGQRMYLSHKMQPIFATHLSGWALTVRLEKQENRDAHATDGMLEAIDNGGKDSVYVMSIQDGADIAGMGGLMGTAMAARE